MKTIDEYMKLPYTVELIPDADEGGFSASIPALPGCLSAGETAEERIGISKRPNMNGSLPPWRKAFPSLSLIPFFDRRQNLLHLHLDTFPGVC